MSLVPLHREPETGADAHGIGAPSAPVRPGAIAADRGWRLLMETGDIGPGVMEAVVRVDEPC
jgi:hypothetical protein